LAEGHDDGGNRGAEASAKPSIKKGQTGHLMGLSCPHDNGQCPTWPVSDSTLSDLRAKARLRSCANSDGCRIQYKHRRTEPSTQFEKAATLTRNGMYRNRFLDHYFVMKPLLRSPARTSAIDSIHFDRRAPSHFGRRPCGALTAPVWMLVGR
jgi:hypothetical protein